MKLIYCKACDSVVRLVMNPRTCECWKTGGMYTDNLNAVYFWKEAHPFGIDNLSFSVRLREDPMENAIHNAVHWSEKRGCDMDWSFRAFSLLRNINGCAKTFKKITKKRWNELQK